MIRKNFLVIVYTLSIVGVITAGFLYFTSNNRDAFDLCKNTALPQQCHLRTLDDIFQNKGPAEAMAYTKKVMAGAESAGECHFLMHEFGHLSYQTNPSLEELLAHGTMYCMGGYYHGVLGEYMTQQKNKIDLRQLVLGACESVRQGPKIVLWECLHGLAHGLMDATNNDLPKSLYACDLLQQQWMQQRCYYGVFMTNSYALKPELRLTSKFISTDDFLYPCNSLAGRYKLECYAYPGRSYLLTRRNPQGYLSQNLEDLRKAFEICESISEGEVYQKSCIGDVAVYIQIAFLRDFEKMREACSLLENSSHRTWCFARTAMFIRRNDVTNEGLAARYCSELPDQSKNLCFTTIGNDVWYPTE